MLQPRRCRRHHLVPDGALLLCFHTVKRLASIASFAIETPNSPRLISLKNSPPPPSTTASFSTYWDTHAPTPHQLQTAKRFFVCHNPQLIYSTHKFRTVQLSPLSEVAFLGRSNVGKSSLLNALFAQKNLAYTSSKPGKTKVMSFYAVGGPDESGNRGRAIVLDMPGYGKGSREEWGTEIVKYLLGRKQLTRAFLLVDAEHGIKNNDLELLQLMRENAISHQVVLSKADKILMPGSGIPTQKHLAQKSVQLRKISEELRKKIQPGQEGGPEALGEIIACSAHRGLEQGEKLGINELRWAVISACGLTGRQQRLDQHHTQVMTGDVEQ